ESLRWFFEGYVPRLCRHYNRLEMGDKDRLYLIYAGGDDLFVVGAWSALPHLAKEIRDEFQKFVGGDHITLSGGIAIEHQKYPLYQLAADAKHALDDQAKAHRLEKNSICLLQKAVGWEQFGEVLEWHTKLLAMLKGESGKDRLPRGFLTRMNEIHALYEENARRQRQLKQGSQVSFDQIKEDIHYSRWLWRLVYQIGRFGERHKNHRAQLNQFQQEISRHTD